MGKGARAVKVAMVGAGYAADFHLACYQRVQRVPVDLVGIVSRTEAKAQALAKRYGIRRVYTDFAELLADADVDVADLCVPVHLHQPMAVALARAGKDVVCEKPLWGYAGEGRTGATPRAEMFAVVQAELAELEAAFCQSGRKLLYAENWVYAPAFRRLVELADASGGAILEIRGNEAHGGSASPFSREWQTSGGGALLRLGIHPLSAAIYLKQWEGRQYAGRPWRVREVWAQTADLTAVCGFERVTPRVVTGWADVENWAVGVLTFDDGARALVTCSDVSLGGIQSYLEVFLSNAHLRCNISQNDTCLSFAPDDQVFGDLFLNEKLETKAGWNFPSVDHVWEAGYAQEIQDFVEAVAQDREPLAGLDLALESIRTAYALYLSAEQGRCVRL
ncbi:MAG: Gfo/Idh/MocA family oxidoreductase [Chloroflexi bacterium]|nr:Gfo/Idh/MocA family oxidoreductase [Chloroflexota bacterium]